MRYGGDDLAKKTLDEINTNDPNKSYLILNAVIWTYFTFFY